MNAHRWIAATLKVGLGLLTGLCAAELGFAARDRQAFPHLNIYERDPVLGVRLRPHATERISFSGNPVTKVRINSDGFRGPELGSPRADEIVVVGDSQAFGLGVEEDQTFSAVLSARLRRPVVNAGVPTYGPAEYDAVLEILLRQRHPKAVVYLVNMSNDLFEASHPNVERHAVWDGWAVRRENAPERILRFPGRELIFRSSHAVFALRGYLYKRRRTGETWDEPRLPSEGDARELVRVGAARKREKDVAVERQRQAERARYDAYNAAELKEWEAGEALARSLSTTSLTDEAWAIPGALRTARADAGDIVLVSYGEGSRPVPVTAEQILRAAQLRRKLEVDLRAKAGMDPKVKEASTAFGKFQEAEAALQHLRDSPVALIRAESPLRPHLERAKRACDAVGARLIVVALPLDVQVSSAEWAKYQVAPQDMSDTHILNADVLATAQAIGAEGFDAEPPLKRAEPGAFLNGDLHMSPAGHRALGEALAEVLSAPPDARSGAAEIPVGRSPVPSAGEWAAAPPKDMYEVPGCKQARVREWLRMVCRGGASPVSMRVVDAGRSEATAFNAGGERSTLRAALVEGAGFVVEVTRAGKLHRLAISLPLGERDPEVQVKAERPAVASPPSYEEARLCLCAQTMGLGRCTEVEGGADDDCAHTYGATCARLLACARGDLEAWPTCPPGKHNVGVTGRCR
jgi:hypothetical protein